MAVEVVLTFGRCLANAVRYFDCHSVPFLTTTLRSFDACRYGKPGQSDNAMFTQRERPQSVKEQPRRSGVSVIRQSETKPYVFAMQCTKSLAKLFQHHRINPKLGFPHVLGRVLWARHLDFHFSGFPYLCIGLAIGVCPQDSRSTQRANDASPS